MGFKEFIHLHDMFIRGFSSIEYPFKPNETSRRKKVFYDRYILGNSIPIVANLNHISHETVKKDSSNAMIQFAQAIGVLVLQEEETKGIRSKK